MAGDNVRYYRVSPRLWLEPWDDDTRLLALYLLTCSHRTTEGLFRLPKPYAQADLGWSAERLAKGFTKLLAAGFLSYDDEAQVVLIRKALKYQQPENPNQVKSAVRALMQLPATDLACEFKRLAERYAKRLAEGLPEGFGEPMHQPPSPSPSPSPSLSSSDVSGKATAPPDTDGDAAASPERELSEPVWELTRLLGARVKANGFKVPAPDSKTLDAWLLEMDRLLRIDGADPVEVRQVIEWATADSFWRANIRSASKLREKYPQLRLRKDAARPSDQEHFQTGGTGRVVG